MFRKYSDTAIELKCEYLHVMQNNVDAGKWFVILVTVAGSCCFFINCYDNEVETRHWR